MTTDGTTYRYEDGILCFDGRTWDTTTDRKVSPEYFIFPSPSPDHHNVERKTFFTIPKLLLPFPKLLAELYANIIICFHLSVESGDRRLLQEVKICDSWIFAIFSVTFITIIIQSSLFVV